jgi:DNA-binding CsgD family transcriptional regulator
MPFELGLTLLVKDMIERRAMHESAASDTFGRALAIFERLDAPLWAAKTRRELPKIAVRGPLDGLTETEHRVAELLAQDRTNREVAYALFVTETPAQTHGRHIFQKLGLKSRTELPAQSFSATANMRTASRSRGGLRSALSLPAAGPVSEVLPATNITDSGDYSAQARNYRGAGQL